jgi:Zn finger protein HypA/HybF involved in hydrogenase expression
MSEATKQQLRCLKCGRTAPPDGDWEQATHPTLGSMTQCPECGSTDVQTKR